MQEMSKRVNELVKKVNSEKVDRAAIDQLHQEITEVYEMHNTKLTSTQIERFVDAYIDNKCSARLAFKDVFGEKKSDADTGRYGRKFLTRPEVQLMLKLKRDQLAEFSMIGKAELLMDLDEIKQISASNPKSPQHIANWIKAVELQAKITGHLDTVTTKVTANLIDRVYVDFNLANEIMEDPTITIDDIISDEDIDRIEEKGGV